MSRGDCVLENARIVHHDDVTAATLSFSSGRVGATPADACCVDLRGHLVFPGLINAHDHLHLNNVPRVVHDTAFANSYEWIAAMEGHRRRPDVTQATAVPVADRHWQGAIKNLLGGATTVVHHDPWHEVFDDPAFPASVVRDVGWSHSLGLGGGVTPSYGPRVADSHAATPPGAPWVIHLAEGTDEVARGELRALDALGCLRANTVLVHGVGLTSEDVRRIVQCGASVVWCPASNLELFGTTLEPSRLAAARHLLLGTDSRLTGSRDLLDELGVAMRRGGVSAADLLRMVTADAARVFHLRGSGALSDGMRADCLILRETYDDPRTALVHASRADLRAVVRDGVPLVADVDFAPWFACAGIDTVEVSVDGRPKLMARSAARAAALALEPGVLAA